MSCYCKILVTVPNESPQSGGNNSLSTLQGVASSLQALRPQGPTITPSLANHVRDDLTNHIKGWPADILEKQVRIPLPAHFAIKIIILAHVLIVLIVCS